jgi:ankyrin repeat protein
MDGVLKNMGWRSFFLGSYVFCANTWATNNEVDNPKHELAMRFGNVPVKRLFGESIAPNSVIPLSCAQHKNEGEMPQGQAITSWHLEIVKLLLDHGIDLNCKRIDQYGHEITPLEEAVKAGDAKTVRLLLEHGADPHWKDLRSRTLLHVVTADVRIPRHAMQIVEILLDQGLDPNSRNDEGQVPLVGVMHNILSETDIRHYFIEESKRAVLHQNQNQNRKKSIKSISKDINCWLQILKLFVNRGSDINAQDNRGNTLLHWAIPFTGHDQKIPTLAHHMHTHSNLKLLKTLIELGADINLPDNAGKTPLDLTFLRKQELCHNDATLTNEYDRMIAFLRKHGAVEGQLGDEVESQSHEEHVVTEEAKGDEN